MEKQLIFEGGKLVYLDEGVGEALVLLHGYCEDSFVWCGWVQALKTKQRVVCIDLPGFGKSAVNENASVDFYFYARAVAAVLNKEKITKATIGGHSMGGYTALHFAEKFPALLSGLVLVNSHCFEDAPEKKENRGKSIRFIQKHGTSFFLQEFYPNLFEPAFTQKNHALIELLHERGKLLSPFPILQAAEAMRMRQDKSAVLKRLQVPVLMLCGALDTAVPKDYSLRMASLPRVCHFHLFKNCGHMVMYEEKGYALKIVKAFFEAINEAVEEAPLV